MKKSNKDLSPGELAMQGHWVSDDEIIEAQRIERRIKKILKKSDIILSQEIGKDLWSAIDHFLYKRSHLKRYISNSEKKALMEDLEKSAYDFAHALENVKNPEIKRDLPMSQVKKSRTKIRELINISKAWGKAASQAKPTIKLGRPTMGDQTPFTEEFALQLAKFF